MAAPERQITPPSINPETAPFWEACNQRRLLLKRCNGCGESHYYPRTICPFCHSADTTWEEVKGEGKVYAFSVMLRAEVPFALAYVTLPENVSLLTNIVDCDPSSVAIGQEVKVVFKAAQNGQLVPMFAPVGAAGDRS